jgi:hypothetical protein
MRISLLTRIATHNNCAVNFETNVITNPQRNITIVCDDENILVPEIHIDNPGSLEITLKCECELHMNGKLVIPQNFPCSSNGQNSDVSIVHILPALWSTFPNFRINPAKSHLNALLLDNFNSSFNPLWMDHVSHLDVSPPKPVISPKLQKLDSYNTDSMTLDFIAAILIFIVGTIFVKIGILIYKCFKSQENQEEVDMTEVHANHARLR